MRPSCSSLPPSGQRPASSTPGSSKRSAPRARGSSTCRRSPTSGSLTHRRFTEDDTELLGLVAERVALAIERGQLHEQTLALDSFKTNLVAVASHELRTPATAVYGVFATLAERGGIAPETRDELI